MTHYYSFMSPVKPLNPSCEQLSQLTLWTGSQRNFLMMFVQCYVTIISDIRKEMLIGNSHLSVFHLLFLCKYLKCDKTLNPLTPTQNFWLSCRVTNIVQGYVTAEVCLRVREEKGGDRGKTGETVSETETYRERIYPQVPKPADFLLLSIKKVTNTLHFIHFSLDQFGGFTNRPATVIPKRC